MPCMRLQCRRRGCPPRLSQILIARKGEGGGETATAAAAMPVRWKGLNPKLFWGGGRVAAAAAGRGRLGGRERGRVLIMGVQLRRSRSAPRRRWRKPQGRRQRSEGVWLGRGGPTDRCNKGLEGRRDGLAGGLQSADLDLLRQGGCPGAHTHWLRCTEHCHTREEEGRREE